MDIFFDFFKSCAQTVKLIKQISVFCQKKVFNHRRFFLDFLDVKKLDKPQCSFKLEKGALLSAIVGV